MDIFETKICPITGLKVEVKEKWQLNHGDYSCKIGVIGESIIISEPRGISIKETTLMFLETFKEITEAYPNTKKFILIDNYLNFKEATREARRAYISYLNSCHKIEMIVYIGLSRKLYLSVNIGKMINYLNFPINISKNYESALSESIKKLSKLDSPNNIFFNYKFSSIKFDKYKEPEIKTNNNLSKILKNPIVSTYIDEFNKYLMNIKWDDYSYKLPIIGNLDENHPLIVLREALSIIKSDVSELIKDFIEQTNILKKTQENLKDLNTNLEKLVEIRTRELAESNRKLKIAKEEAELANKGKAVFLASISHELKTPLNSILSYSSMAVSKIDKLSQEKIINYFSQVNTSGKRLLTLVESLIDITKFEAGAMIFNFSESNILDSMDMAISEVSSLANAKNIKIHLTKNLITHVFTFDKMRIIQVFVNILYNSVKFTPENRNIYIDLQNKDNNFICMIKDEGMGINKDELELIFDIFKRGKNATSSTGTGLGLAISKNIITAHNGRIWASNNNDIGSIFTVEIPIKKLNK